MDAPPTYDSIEIGLKRSANGGTSGKQQQRLQNQDSGRKQMVEIRLYDNIKERGRCEDLADLFAIIKATEALEAAYGRDALTTSEYNEGTHCILYLLRIILIFNIDSKSLVFSVYEINFSV
jgi:hypothetical protein